MYLLKRYIYVIIIVFIYIITMIILWTSYLSIKLNFWICVTLDLIFHGYFWAKLFPNTKSRQHNLFGE